MATDSGVRRANEDGWGAEWTKCEEYFAIFALGGWHLSATAGKLSVTLSATLGIKKQATRTRQDHSPRPHHRKMLKLTDRLLGVHGASAFEVGVFAEVMVCHWLSSWTSLSS